MSIVAVCCTLHNVCELKIREFFGDWLQNIDIDLGENIPSPGFGLGQEIREEIKNFLERNLL